MTFMDPVATLVDDFKIVGGLVVDRRPAAVLNARSAYVEQAAVPFTVNPVAAHNLTGRDLDVLPEADRNTEAVQFYARDGSFPGGVTGNSTIGTLIPLRNFNKLRAPMMCCHIAPLLMR